MFNRHICLKNYKTSIRGGIMFSRHFVLFFVSLYFSVYPSASGIANPEVNVLPKQVVRYLISTKLRERVTCELSQIFKQPDSFQRLQAYLNSGNPNLIGDYGMELLHLAASHGCEAIVKLLVENCGVNAMTVDQLGFVPGDYLRMALVKNIHRCASLKNTLNAHEENDFQRRKEIRSLDGIPTIEIFMNTFDQKCNKTLVANQALDSGIVARASSYLEPANIIRFLSNVVSFPGASIVGEIGGQIGDMITEQQEQARRDEYFAHDPRALPREFQKLAYVLSQQYEASLQKLSAEGARKLGEYCANRVKDYLYNHDAYSRSINKGQSLVIQVLEYLKGLPVEVGIIERMTNGTTVRLQLGGEWKKKEIVNGNNPSTIMRWSLIDGMRNASVLASDDQDLIDQEEVARIETLLSNTDSLPEEQNEIFIQALNKETQAINYERGQGVLQNPLEAARLYEKAFQLYKNLADNHNHARAQYHCGIMCLEGRGAEKNVREGERLLLLACDKGYGPAEYRLYQFYKDSNPVLAQQLLVRATLHAHEEARALFKNVLKDVDLSEPGVRLYLTAIVELIVTDYVNEGMNATHSSWNHPDLLWHLYTEKASPGVFTFLQRRLPGYIEQTRDAQLKTLLHRLLEDWEQEHDSWFQAIFDLALNGLQDADIFDGTGKSLLDISCIRLHVNPFQQLVKKRAKKLKLDQLETVVAFYQHIKRHKEANAGNIEFNQAFDAFKQLEKQNFHLKFRMAMEHLLGGYLTRREISSNTPMIGTFSGHKVLPLSIFHAETRRVIRANTDGRSTVAKATTEGYTLYFKFFPELPGIEQAVSMLTHDLIGLGTTISELFKIPTALQVPVLKPGWITGESLDEETVSDIPVLVSLGIEGRTLKQVFENPIDPATQLNILENLDKDSLHSLMLVAMLTNPEDGKGDNYIAEPFITKDGQVKYRIIGIDNDHAFVPPLASAASNRVRINTKTILYAFAQITEPINVSTLFTSLDLDVTLRSWLGRLRDLNRRYIEVFGDPSHNEMLFQRYRSFIGIPFSKDALAYLYTKFIRLREALASSDQLKPIDLFMKVEPFLSGRYGEEIRATAELRVFERFKKIEGEAATKTLSRPIDVLTSYHIPDTPQSREAILKGQRYSPGQATDELEEVIAVEFDKIQSGQIEPFRRLKRGDQVEAALETIALQEKHGKGGFAGFSLEENVQFLKTIQDKLSLMHRLNLRNHQSFKTKDIKEWTNDVLKRLTHITLSGCKEIDEDALVYLSEQADNLVYLDFSNNGRLQKVARRKEGARGSSLPLSFKILRYLDVSGCIQLSQIDIETPKLEVLKVQGNQGLGLLKGKFPKLRFLDMRNVQGLGRLGMVDFIVSNPFFLNNGHLEMEENNLSREVIKEALHFLKGKLVYSPQGVCDYKGGRIELPIATLQNPFEDRFDLSNCSYKPKQGLRRPSHLPEPTYRRSFGYESYTPSEWRSCDLERCKTSSHDGLSINTGYKKKIIETEAYDEIWIVPRFMIEKDAPPYYREILNKWTKEVTIGIFWTKSNSLVPHSYLITKPAHLISNPDWYAGGFNNLHDELALLTGGEDVNTQLHYSDGIFYYPSDSKFAIRFCELK